MKGKPISGSAIVLVLICFFLPWVTVSCDGSDVVTLSGYELSVGKVYTNYGEKTEADPLVFVVPAAVLLAVGALFIANAKVSGAGQLVCAAAGLGIMGLKWQTMLDGQTASVKIATEYGAWGTLAGLLLLLLGGVLTLAIKESPPLSHGPPPRVAASRPPPPPPTVVSPPSPQPTVVPSPLPQPTVVSPPLPQPQTAVNPSQCPQCQTSLRPGARFCQICGHKM